MRLRAPLLTQNTPTLIVYGGRLANWNRRTLIINYCVDVLDASYGETKRAADDANGDDVRARRKAQAELYSADIKVGPSCASVPSDLELLHCFIPTVRCSAYPTPQRAHRRGNCSGEISKRYETCFSYICLTFLYSSSALRARCKYFEPPSNDPEAKRD